jgi:hypothetical protein
MAWSRVAGFILTGYNPLLVANAPGIGTATAGTNNCASIAFTAPSDIGGGAISSYTVFSNCGAFRATGGASPLTVTGLTAGTSYTFRAIATNSFGPSGPSSASNSITAALVQGQQAFTTAGTFTWVAPAGVTRVSVVAVGGGGGSGRRCATYPATGGGGGGGGALAYVNNATVVPGTSYTVVVGAGGLPSNTTAGVSAGQSNFTISGVVVAANGGSARAYQQGLGGTVVTGTGFSGGNSGFSCCNLGGGGGGGAGGYTGVGGAGGAGGTTAFVAGSNGAGGSGAGGSGSTANGAGGAGGGVGLLGLGSSGVANTGVGGGGGGGSCGATGGNGTTVTPGTGGTFGGGSGGARNGANSAVNGSVGAVRIIWPGTTRSFPSTNTGDL